MADTTIINGKAVAEALRTRVKDAVMSLTKDYELIPGLAVVLVGEDPASQVYVRNKKKQTVEVGMISFDHQLDTNTPEADLLDLIDKLNNDSSVHGILVQLPMPDHIDAEKVIDAIDPTKDVDGFHTINVGRLSTGKEGMVPCTPLGCLMMLKDQLGSLSGKNAVVVGRSNIVGKPMAALLLRESCTVTVAHSRTEDLPGLCRSADILVAAVGLPKMIEGDWIKPGATVIDVGINRVPKDEEPGKFRLVGDVDFVAAKEIAGAITPVPGGVGPMTVAMLMGNTVKAAEMANA